MSAMNKYYIKDMVDNMFNHLKDGHTVHLQWECMSCHEKITADDPMYIVKDASGEECVALHKAYLHSVKDDGSLCGITTPIDAKAFNFMLIMGVRL